MNAVCTVLWALIQSHAAQGKGLYLGLPDGYAAGPLTNAGLY
jgi:hypothetical protein